MPSQRSLAGRGRRGTFGDISNTPQGVNRHSFRVNIGKRRARSVDPPFGRGTCRVRATSQARVIRLVGSLDFAVPLWNPGIYRVMPLNIGASLITLRRLRLTSSEEHA